MLKEAIQSVLNQTYSDYEIIVVDDGSTDNTLEVVNAFSEKRVRYVLQQNRGPSNARNHAISLARGKYIAFLDSDDLFLPTKMEKQIACMEENPGILLSHTSYLRIGAEGEFIEEVQSGTFSGKVYPHIIRHCPIATPTVLILRAALGENLRFIETIQIGEDVILWTQLARKSTILGIDEPLSKVRIHGHNAALDPRQQIIGLMNIIEYTIRRNPDLSFLIRRMLLSDIYLNIGFNYLRTRNRVQFLKFLGLAEYMQPLEPPLFMMCRLSSMLHLEPVGRFRRIYGKLRANESE
jgi:glycosyltransferase involved in cell wall biosynthesis